jgi:hypothetical protein
MLRRTDKTIPRSLAALGAAIPLAAVIWNVLSVQARSGGDVSTGEAIGVAFGAGLGLGAFGGLLGYAVGSTIAKRVDTDRSSHGREDD